jgi:SAM-dependent methyltransferase
MLGHLAERRGPISNLFPMLADGTVWLPFRAAGIYAIAVLIHHHACDAARLILNLAESLVPGGRMVLDLPLYEVAREPVDWTDVGVWTLRMLQDVAAAAGLRLDSAEVLPGAFSWEVEHHHEWVVLTRPCACP